MENKEIYEHLAQVYLGGSSARRQQHINPEPRKRPQKSFIIIGIALAVLVVNFIVLAYFSHRKKVAVDAAFERVIQSEVVGLKFDFQPVKKEIYTINFGAVDLSGFKTLAFSAKKSDSHANLALRMELINSFREKSEVYIRDMSNRWQTYRIHLEDFKNIHDWSEILSLSFIVEEWNSSTKNGAVYIDDVKFLK